MHSNDLALLQRLFIKTVQIRIYVWYSFFFSNSLYRLCRWLGNIQCGYLMAVWWQWNILWQKKLVLCRKSHLLKMQIHCNEDADPNFNIIEFRSEFVIWKIYLYIQINLYVHSEVLIDDQQEKPLIRLLVDFSTVKKIKFKF